MPTVRLFSPVQLCANAELSLGGEQARYVGRVLRLRPGDSLTVFDGNGGEYAANVGTITKSGVRLNVGKHNSRNTESPLRIRVVQGVSRAERMDIVVQKGTELGVYQISPVITEYSVVKLDPRRAAKRLGHWTKIAASACEQSGRNEMPLIDAPQALHEVLDAAALHDAACLVLDPTAARTLPSIARPPGQLTILIGPEGGLSDNEKEQAQAAGFAAVAFGPRILRTETAALAAIAALQSLFGDLGNNT